VLHKEIPFLRIGLPLCLGIISGLHFHPGNKVIIILIAIIASCFVISTFFNKRINNYFFGFSLFVALVISGNILYNNEKSRLSVLEQTESVFLCSLTDYPEEKETTFSVTVKLLRKFSGKETIPLNGSMLLYHKKTDTLMNISPGDFLIIKCTPIEVVNKGNPCEFDYRFYLENRGIKYFAFTESANILKTSSPDKRTLQNHAFIIRKKIVGMFEERGIRGEKLALVAAITLGQRSLLDPGTKLNFAKAGAMHIMAVSGLNAGILSIFIFNILFFMKGKLGTLRAILTILIIWLFAFITGMSPSVERATLMFSFIQAGKLINRQVNGINSVLASAFVMMLIQPSVIFDTGFQLSYLAVLFIIGFYEDLYSKLIFKNKLPALVWQAIVVTIIAQAGTLALTIMSFNRFPVYFLLTNIIVVPVSSLMIILACLIIFTYPVPFLSGLIAKLLNLSTYVTEESTRIISSLDHSSIDNIGMTALQCILLTIFIASFLYYLLRKDSFSLHFPLIFLFSFVVTGTIISIKHKRSNELIVYNTPGTFTLAIRTGNTVNLYRKKDIAVPPEVIRHCSVMGFEIRSDTLPDGIGRFRVDTTDILICNNITDYDSLVSHTDILVLTGKYPEYNNNINGLTLPRNTIITSEADIGFTLPVTSNKNIYYVRKSGARIISL
jgi:competence protein ComEC